MREKPSLGFSFAEDALDAQKHWHHVVFAQAMFRHGSPAGRQDLSVTLGHHAHARLSNSEGGTIRGPQARTTSAEKVRSVPTTDTT